LRKISAEAAVMQDSEESLLRDPPSGQRNAIKRNSQPALYDQNSQSRLISFKKVLQFRKKDLQCLANSAKMLFCEAAREAIREDR
jgi:hypothetical protein